MQYVARCQFQVIRIFLTPQYRGSLMSACYLEFVAQSCVTLCRKKRSDVFWRRCYGFPEGGGGGGGHSRGTAVGESEVGASKGEHPPGKHTEGRT